MAAPPLPNDAHFATYAPRAADAPPRLPPVGLVVRVASLADAAAMARIRGERVGSDPGAYVPRFVRDLANAPRPPDDMWLAAVLDGELVGYSKVASFVPAADAPGNVAPAGYYLAGVSVATRARRCGVGAALTAERLRWIAARASAAYYVANSRNLASIAMHERFGFVEIGRNVAFPGVVFDDGASLLFRADVGSLRSP